MIAARLRARGWAVTLAAVLALSTAACGSAPGPSASPTAPPADLVSPVIGVLTHIEATGLTQVTGFTLRLDDGREIGFRVGLLENGNVFPPGHLAEHLQALSPVRVFFRLDGNALVVYRLEDAVAPSPS